MVTRMRSRWNNKNGGGRCSTRSSSSLLNELQRRLRPRYVGPICCLRDPDSIGHRLEKPSRLTFPFESCRLRVFPLELIFGYNPPLNVSSTLSTHLCHSTKSRSHPWNVFNLRSNNLILSSHSKTLRKRHSLRTRYRALNWTMLRIGSSASFSRGHTCANADRRGS